DKIELIMSKSFAEIGKVQFMGYISILEREYGIDLSDLRQEYTNFTNNNSALMGPKQSVVLQGSTDSKSKWMIAGAIAILLLIGMGYFMQSKMSVMPGEEVMKLTTQSVEVAEEVHERNVSESNVTGEMNTTAQAINEVNGTVSPLSQPIVSGRQIVIKPSYKVWYGMIDLSSGQRVQNITSDPIIIDTSKNWLIFMGHGRIVIDINGEKTVLKGKETLRFVCESGTLKQITRAEFIERNGGKNW
ncbi:hypothetical protein, partial [Sulfuricurvum sp.]|uniref:hypothetical protein n=1 Tax=Sulfuricurvum sp. TaxID=2025608 RepID=UPI0025D19C1D